MSEQRIWKIKIEYIKINGKKKQNRKKQKKGYEIQLNEAKIMKQEVKSKRFLREMKKVSQIGFEIYEEKEFVAENCGNRSGKYIFMEMKGNTG